MNNISAHTARSLMGLLEQSASRFLILRFCGDYSACAVLLRLSGLFTFKSVTTSFKGTLRK